MINIHDADILKEALARRQSLSGGAVAVEKEENIKEIIPGNGEIILSEHYRAPFNKLMPIPSNVMVLGLPGTGKTHNMILPNIMSMNGSYIAVDICGEMLHKVRPMLEENGYTVKVLNLSDTRIATNQYNPFEYFRNITDIKDFVDCITYEPKADIFWKETEKALLTAAILCLKTYSDSAIANFEVLKRMLSKELHQVKSETNGNDTHEFWDDSELYASISEKIERDIRPYDGECDVVKCYDLYNRAPVRTKIGIIAKVIMYIKPFVDLCGGRDLNYYDTMELESVRRKRTAIFVIPDTSGKDESIAVTRAFFMQAYREMEYAGENRDSIPLYMLLDEAEYVGAIPGFEKALLTGQKYKTYTLISLEEEEQLKTLYPEWYKEIMENIGCKLTMYDNCQCTLQCGEYTILDRQAILSNELNARQLCR